MTNLYRLRFSDPDASPTPEPDSAGIKNTALVGTNQTERNQTEETSSGNAPARDGAIGKHLAHLQPLIDNGQLDHPAADGSDTALLVAVQQHGDEVVTRALDHVVSWATGTGKDKLSTTCLRRLLPAAIDKAQQPAAPVRRNGRRPQPPPGLGSSVTHPPGHGQPKEDLGFPPEWGPAPVDA